MNYKISILFRAIPLVMAAICFAYGIYIFSFGNVPDRLTAGPVVFFLGSICVALFATAATIIRQIIGTYTTAAKYILPTVGYLFAVVTLCMGLAMVWSGHPYFFVSGHVVCGLGLIAGCVSTAATASTRFSLIPENSARSLPANDMTPAPNPKGFTASQGAALEIVAVAITIAAWIWAVSLLAKSGHSTQYLVAGSVMGGIASVCTSLIALVSSIVRQIRGNYRMSERSIWIWLVLTMGLGVIVWGLVMIMALSGHAANFVGYILIGLGLICLSISSKVILLAKIWHTNYPLAKRIPIIPVVTALACLFLAAFLFEASLGNPKFFVPARVLVGFGAICFTLFSIVSILESGATKKAA